MSAPEGDGAALAAQLRAAADAHPAARGAREPGEPLATVERRDGALRVLWRTYEGRPFVSLETDGPRGPRSVAVRLGELPAVARAIAAALDRAARTTSSPREGAT